MKRNRRYILIGLAIALFLFLLFTNNQKNKSATAHKGINNLDAEKVTINPNEDQFVTHIPIDKVWTFDFDEELDVTTINNQTIFIEDENESKIETTYELINDRKTIKINPPESYYVKGSTYKIHLTKSIQTIDGNSISEEQMISFNTERDEIEEIKVNEDLIPIDAKYVKEINVGSIVLDKSAGSILHKNDIILLSNEVGEEQAYKIVAIKNNVLSYKLEVITPKFEELFDELILYKTYDLTEENIDLDDVEKGITIEQASMSNPSLQLVSADENILIEREKTINYKIDDHEISVKGEKFKLNGNVDLTNSVVYSDIEIGENNRMQLSSKLMVESNLNITGEVIKNRDTAKKLKKKLKKFDEEILLGRINIPVPSSPLSIQGKLLLRVTGGINGEVNTEVYMKVENENGVYYENDEFTPINNFKSDFRVNLHGQAKLHMQAGAVAELGVRAFWVSGVAIEGFAGLFLDGEAHGGASTTAGGGYACTIVDFGPFVEGKFMVDALVFGAEMEFLNDRSSFYKSDNCEVLTKIKADKGEMAIDWDEEATVALKGEYLNLTDQKKRHKDIDSEEFEISVSPEEALFVKQVGKELKITANKNSSVENAVIQLRTKIDNGYIKNQKEVVVEIPVMILREAEEEEIELEKEIVEEEEQEEAESETTLSLTQYEGYWQSDTDPEMSGISMDLNVIEGNRAFVRIDQWSSGARQLADTEGEVIFNDDIGTFKFVDTGWESEGEITIKLIEDKVLLKIVQTKANEGLWGILDGDYELVR